MNILVILPAGMVALYPGSRISILKYAEIGEVKKKSNNFITRNPL